MTSTPSSTTTSPSPTTTTTMTTTTTTMTTTTTTTTQAAATASGGLGQLNLTALEQMKLDLTVDPKDTSGISLQFCISSFIYFPMNKNIDFHHHQSRKEKKTYLQLKLYCVQLKLNIIQKLRETVDNVIERSTYFTLQPRI